MKKPFERWNSPPGHFEVRPDHRGAVDEIVAVGCALHIERMSGHHWFMLIELPDGTQQCFWFGSSNDKTRVEFTHSEVRPPLSTGGSVMDPGETKNG